MKGTQSHLQLVCPLGTGAGRERRSSPPVTKLVLFGWGGTTCARSLPSSRLFTGWGSPFFVTGLPGWPSGTRSKRQWGPATKASSSSWCNGGSTGCQPSGLLCLRLPARWAPQCRTRTTMVAPQGGLLLVFSHFATPGGRRPSLRRCQNL